MPKKVIGRKKEPKLAPSVLSAEEAEWMASVNTETCRLMAERLKASTNTRMPIDSLDEADLTALAEIARATYIVALSRRIAELKLKPDEVNEEAQLWLI